MRTLTGKSLYGLGSCLVAVLILATPAYAAPDEDFVAAPSVDADEIQAAETERLLGIPVQLERNRLRWFVGVANHNAFLAEIDRQNAEREAAEEARDQSRESEPRTARAVQPAVAGTGACGGDLPDCSIMNCESGGSLTAENGRSSAAGKWQFVIGTSNNLAHAMGRPDLVGVPASRWTEAEQDEAARILWRGGAGAGNWEQCL